MEQILSFVINLIQNGPAFDQLGYYLVIYFVVLWLAFSAWVFFDANKRFNNLYIAAAWFLIVFFGNFPFLIFYIVVRPEFIEGYEYHSEDIESNAVNVPLVNFVGEKGIDMQISLKINESALNTETVQKLKLGIDLEGVSQVDGQDGQSDLNNEEETREEATSSNENSFLASLQSFRDKFVGAIRNFWNDLKEGMSELRTIEQTTEEKNESEDTDDAEEQEDEDNSEKKDKKNKNK